MSHSAEAKAVQEELLQFTFDHVLPVAQKNGDDLFALALLTLAKYYEKFGKFMNVIETLEKIFKREGSIKASLLCEVYDFAGEFYDESLKDSQLAYNYQLKVSVLIIFFLPFLTIQALNLCLATPVADAGEDVFLRLAKRAISFLNKSGLPARAIQLFTTEQFERKLSLTVHDNEGSILVNDSVIFVCSIVGSKAYLLDLYTQIALSYFNVGDVGKFEEYTSKSKELQGVVNRLEDSHLARLKAVADHFKSTGKYEDANVQYQNIIDILSPPEQGEPRLPSDRQFGGMFLETCFTLTEVLFHLKDFTKCITFSILALDSTVKYRIDYDTEIYLTPKHSDFVLNFLKCDLKLHLGIIESLSDLSLLLRCRFHIGMLQFQLNAYQQAVNAFEDCLKLVSEVESDSKIASSLYKEMGRSYDELKDPENALAAYQKGIAIVEEFIKVPSTRQMWSNEHAQFCLLIARYFHKKDEYLQAIEYFLRALAANKASGTGSDLNQIKINTIYAYMIHNYEKVKNYDKAIEYQKKVLEIQLIDAPERHLDDSVGTCYLNLSKFYEEKGNFASAAEYYAAYAHINQRRKPSSTVSNSNKIAKLLGQCEDYKAQINTYLKIIAGMDEGKSDYQLTCEKLADTFLKVEDYGGAIEYFIKTNTSIVASTGEQYWTKWRSRILGKVSDAYARLGDNEKAQEFKIQSLALYEKPEIPFMTPVTDSKFFSKTSKVSDKDALFPTYIAPKSIAPLASRNLSPPAKLCLSSLPSEVLRLILEASSFETLKSTLLLDKHFETLTTEVYKGKPVVLFDGFYQHINEKNDLVELYRFYEDHLVIRTSVRLDNATPNYAKIFDYFKRPHPETGVWVSSSLGTLSWSTQSDVWTVAYSGRSIDFGNKLEISSQNYFTNRRSDLLLQFVEYQFEHAAESEIIEI
jgi:tetratricopeptide (TPR) repeat protein